MRQWRAVCRHIEIDHCWQRGEKQKLIARSNNITQGRVWQILRSVEKIKHRMAGLHFVMTDVFDVAIETEVCRDQCFSFEYCYDGGLQIVYGRDKFYADRI